MVVYCEPKTKVAPLKRQSIPRLGALILARLTQVVARSIPKLSEHFFWVDSMTVLCWIRNDRVWKQYVPHRADEIRKISDKKAWRHCPGHLNPADLPSRGISASELNGRFIKKCKKQPGARGCNVIRSEMNYAELLWIRAVQRCLLAREIQYLKSPTFPCPVLVNHF